MQFNFHFQFQSPDDRIGETLDFDGEDLELEQVDTNVAKENQDHADGPNNCKSKKSRMEQNYAVIIGEAQLLAAVGSINNEVTSAVLKCLKQFRMQIRNGILPAVTPDSLPNKDLTV